MKEIVYTITAVLGFTLEHLTTIKAIASNFLRTCKTLTFLICTCCKLPVKLVSLRTLGCFCRLPVKLRWLLHFLQLLIIISIFILWSHLPIKTMEFMCWEFVWYSNSAGVFHFIFICKIYIIIINFANETFKIYLRLFVNCVFKRLYPSWN